MSRRRKNLLTAMVIVLLLGLSLAQHLRPRPAKPGATEPATESRGSLDRQRYDGKDFTVTKVVDGDTLDIDVADPVGGQPTTRVRLWGVDTPETKHPKLDVMYFGPEAAAFARQHVLGKRITLRLEPFQSTRGKYGRLLAYVYFSAEEDPPSAAWMLNEQLINQGYGYADERFDHMLRERFIQLQKHAQKRARGLWAEATPEQFPQWYRSRHYDKE